MRFVLDPDAVAKLTNIRTTYQSEKGVDLQQKPGFFSMPIMLGGTDVKSRDKQISFLERIIFTLRGHLLKKEEIKTYEQLMLTLRANRVVIAAWLYIQSQIGSSKRRSVLYRQIEDDLGISKMNYLDEEDKNECILAADGAINSDALVQANAALKEADYPPFTEVEWRGFSDFLKANCPKEKVNDSPNYLPITSLTRPLFGTVLSYTGVAAGLISGDVICSSTAAMNPHMKLTAMIGSTLLVFTPAGPASAAFIAPVVASRLLTSVCNVSLANALGWAMGILGQGVGIAVGVPLDVSYQLLRKACVIIGSYYFPEPGAPLITGLRVGDGKLVVHGLVLEFMPEDKLPTDCQRKNVEIRDDGKVIIDGVAIDAAADKTRLPKETMDELKKRIEQRANPSEDISDDDVAEKTRPAPYEDELYPDEYEASRVSVTS